MAGLKDRLTDGMLMIEAKKIARKSIIEDAEDAKAVLEVFAQNEPITEVIKSRSSAISVYTGLVRRMKERGEIEEAKRVERSIEIWNEELKTIKEAMEIAGYIEN